MARRSRRAQARTQKRPSRSISWPYSFVEPEPGAALTRFGGRIAVLIRAGRAPVLILATTASFFRSTAIVWSAPDIATYMYLLSGVGVIQLAVGPTSTAPMYFRSGSVQP